MGCNANPDLICLMEISENTNTNEKWKIIENRMLQKTNEMEYVFKREISH